MTHGRCLGLDDERARDPSVVGAKAAALSLARGADLPVLPGVVVPAAEAGAVLDVVRPLVAGGELGRVRRAAMGIEPDEGLLAELRAAVADLGTPLIVRSSSPLEEHGVWSGAFSSLQGIGPGELGTALRACWGSAFAPDAMERAEHEGVEVDDLALAVLVQPEIRPEVGGTARTDPAGRVTVSATHGPLRGLMEGWVEGHRASVSPDGEVEARGVAEAVVADVAALARTTRERLGHDLIEWAHAEGRVVLLQSMASQARPAASSTATTVTAAHGTPEALALALLTQRFPGPLGEDLVLPWAVAAPGAAADVEPAIDDLAPPDRLARAQAAANDLTARCWAASPRGAGEDAARTLRLLRGNDPERALERLAALSQPPAVQVRAALADLARLRDDLVAHGVVDDPWSFWRLTVAELEDAVHGRPVARAARAGVGRWEPFVHAVVRASGDPHEGVPVAGGAGGGPVHVVDDVLGQEPPSGRYVLVAPSPLPALSPLLWQAAGLVTRGGNTGAHVLEFAASIGVPTVVGVRLPDLDPAAGWWAAVDGDAGLVSVLPTRSVRAAV